MDRPTLSVGLVGAGMIVAETYLPALRPAVRRHLYQPATGPVALRLAGIASRTGDRAREIAAREAEVFGPVVCPAGPNAVEELLSLGPQAVCVATPDDRHFAAARLALDAGRHVLVEKPSVLRLAELDELVALARRRGVLAKVVYHKLLDPDHKKLRTLVADGVLRDVTAGYCTLLEPLSVATGQFAEWVRGRNPATYVACHYYKLIDWTFGGRLLHVQATGQRGVVGPANGDTWDAVQTRLVYEYDGGRTAAFDVHTSWVTPEEFPGYVEQEVQFRFRNGLWHGHGRRRGVELTVAGETPTKRKASLNNHYNGQFFEPWGERAQRGYGVEAVTRFLEEVAHVEFGGPPAGRADRLVAAQGLTYNDLAADREVVAAVQATEALLAAQVPTGAVPPLVTTRHAAGELVLLTPGSAEVAVLA